jgi:NADPH:quinone reductase
VLSLNPSTTVLEPRNRVVQVRRFGGPEGLEVVDAPLPTAGRGKVRVRALASGLEYTDVVIRRHLYPQTSARRPPFVMGYDVVGEIDQLGDGVSGFQFGDRVADMTVLASNAAYRTLRASDLTRVACRGRSVRRRLRRARVPDEQTAEAIPRLGS